MKKQDKVNYDQLDKSGIVLSGFIQIDNDLRVKISVACGPYGWSVYSALWSHRCRKTGKCFPSIATLSRETGIGERKISDVINDLEINGFIIVRSGGMHKANTYWFPMSSEFDDGDVEPKMAYRRTRLNPNKKSKKSIVEQEEYDNTLDPF